MSAPVDPRPYAGPTDLVTAADVAEWLVDYPGSCAAQASIDLHERLERERRQACRRGARYHWRRVCVLVRWTRTVHGAQWAWDDCGESVARSISRALAFRAAARQP